MPFKTELVLIVAVLVLISASQCIVNAVTEEKKIHIVYMGSKPTEEYNVESQHLSLLEQALETSSPQESLVYSYSKSFNGFAAWLTDREQKKLEGTEGVVSVIPSATTYELYTTNSWDFVGFPTTVKRIPDVESNIIIGVFDTGIWPESESFNDKGLGPPPSKWKGVCQNFTCNNKIIGARFYKADGNWTMEERSPRDPYGHGTHTTSTAAGREVNASYFGIAEGIARGAVPSARIAVYKVCYARGCAPEDILAAFDDAIADGVDIISVSIGSTAQVDFSKDVLALGAYHATQKGILVSAAAGNSGPKLRTMSNVAPWIFTVGLSTTNRRITTNITLGNNMTLQGVALNAFPTPPTASPLIFGGNAAIGTTKGDSRCIDGTLDKNLVNDKIVVCSELSPGGLSLDAGADATVMVANLALGVPASTYALPATVVNIADYRKLLFYMKHTRDPTAIIYRSGSTYNSQAPAVAHMSSRGPSVLTPLILKPDIIAPGFEILAAYSGIAPVSGYSGPDHSAKYNIFTGTSMACPHVSGAAAYVKTFHTTWSASAIKSALMTTASSIKTFDSAQGDFAFGAGEINPVRAVDPGLVYDTLESDYVIFFCNLGYSTEKIKIMTGQDVACGKRNGTEADLNYPSMTAYVNSTQPISRSFTRTVTNVGSANSIYKATLKNKSSLKISVTPSALSFMSLNEKQSFTVNVDGVLTSNTVISAALTWSDGVYSVRSPIVVLVEV